jgi:hypothetical protein
LTRRGLFVKKAGSDLHPLSDLDDSELEAKLEEIEKGGTP